MFVDFEGHRYTVTFTTKQKSGLTGVAIDGKDIGNFRTEPDFYRCGMGVDAVRIPRSEPPERAAEKVALMWLVKNREKNQTRSES